MSDGILFPSWTSYNFATLLMRDMSGFGNCLQQNLCGFIFEVVQETEVLAFRGRNTLQSKGCISPSAGLNIYLLGTDTCSINLFRYEAVLE
jgi:hypothetical protein